MARRLRAAHDDPGPGPGKGLTFFGVSEDGYSVPALNHHHEKLCGGTVFQTKGEAAMMAGALNMPGYVIWNGRSKKYAGTGHQSMAYPRRASAG